MIYDSGRGFTGSGANTEPKVRRSTDVGESDQGYLGVPIAFPEHSQNNLPSLATQALPSWNEVFLSTCRSQMYKMCLFRKLSIHRTR